MVRNAQVKLRVHKSKHALRHCSGRYKPKISGRQPSHDFIILWAFTELHQQSTTVVPAYRKTCFQALFTFFFFENYCHLLSQ